MAICILLRIRFDLSVPRAKFQFSSARERELKPLALQLVVAVPLAMPHLHGVFGPVAVTATERLPLDIAHSANFWPQTVGLVQFSSGPVR